MVAARYTETGTFTRPAFGHEPMGRFYELVAMDFFEIEGGKIERRWGPGTPPRNCGSSGCPRPGHSIGSTPLAPQRSGNDPCGSVPVF